MQSVVKNLAAGEGLYRLEAILLPIGCDLHVTLYGGDTPHIGAIAVARVDAADRISVESISVGTHREGVVVDPAAERLATVLGHTVVVSAGMHWHQIDSAGISQVLENARLLVDMIIDNLRGAGAVR